MAPCSDKPIPIPELDSGQCGRKAFFCGLNNTWFPLGLPVYSGNSLFVVQWFISYSLSEWQFSISRTHDPSFSPRGFFSSDQPASSDPALRGHSTVAPSVTSLRSAGPCSLPSSVEALARLVARNLRSDATGWGPKMVAVLVYRSYGSWKKSWIVEYTEYQLNIELLISTES